MKIEDREQIIESQLENPDVSGETVETVMDALEAIGQARGYIVQDDGYRAHLIDFIATYDGQACSCSAPNCPLKHGQVPPAVTLSSKEWEDSIDEWAASHGGDASALVEAKEAFSDRESKVKRTLKECVIALRQDDPTRVTAVEV